MAGLETSTTASRVASRGTVPFCKLSNARVPVSNSALHMASCVAGVGEHPHLIVRHPNPTAVTDAQTACAAQKSIPLHHTEIYTSKQGCD